MKIQFKEKLEFELEGYEFAPPTMLPSTLQFVLVRSIKLVVAVNRGEIGKYWWTGSRDKSSYDSDLKHLTDPAKYTRNDAIIPGKIRYEIIQAIKSHYQ